jgi:predicted acylesterase/phospholipase RssA
MTRIQPIVLSGGGSRGPYGAGVLRAVRKYNQERHFNIVGCYCGTSVGALNAVMAAQGDLDGLLDLYSKLTTKNVIGENKVDISGWGLWRKANNSPFYYYSNDALRRTIGQYVNFDKLKDSDAHLLICVTNFDTGDLETFYHSDLVPTFIEFDNQQIPGKRRLTNYHKIDNQESLVNALLASAAVPFFLPPVKIGQHYYVDGGVGNNTPTREAAYFCRFLSDSETGIPESTICVINDSARFVIDDSKDDRYKLEPIINRTMDIYQHELVRDFLVTWDRINLELQLKKEQQYELINLINTANYLTEDQRDQIVSDMKTILAKTTGGTTRRELELIRVRPSTPLPVENLLTFDPAISLQLIRRGTSDCLTTFCDRNLISQQEQELWINVL